MTKLFLIHDKEEHPVFVLSFCVFKKSDYSQMVAPAVCTLKFDFWGHDSIVLHSHKIRKQVDDFSILANLTSMERFMKGLNDLIDTAPFTIISTIIDKRQLKNRYSNPRNPYHLGLLFCLSVLLVFLKRKDRKPILPIWW
jgi:hypothetical protein